MERKLQHYFAKPSFKLGNELSSQISPPVPSGFGIVDYFVNYEAYQENGEKFIKATGFIQIAGYAKAWLASESRKGRPPQRPKPQHQTQDQDKLEATIVPLLPFGGGTSIFIALYNADTHTLVKFTYGALL